MSFKIIGIGELLWDLLPQGRQMGGAPANFAFHARALGADALVLSRVGDDPLGREIVERLESLGVPVSGVSIDPARPTGTVSVELADGQPRYTIHEGAAWDNLQPDPEAMRIAAGADAICFGTLGQRCEPSRSTIRAIVSTVPRAALRVFDINLRQQYYSRGIIAESLSLANALKLNDNELPIVSEMLGVPGSVEEQIATLARRYELRLVAYTRGARGSLLYNGERWSDHPGLPVKMRDSIGAGDAFTAAATLGFLAGCDLDIINRTANELAAHVCSHDGATPPMPDHLRHIFNPS